MQHNNAKLKDSQSQLFLYNRPIFIQYDGKKCAPTENWQFSLASGKWKNNEKNYTPKH